MNNKNFGVLGFFNEGYDFLVHIIILQLLMVYNSQKIVVLKILFINFQKEKSILLMEKIMTKKHLNYF